MDNIVTYQFPFGGFTQLCLSGLTVVLDGHSRIKLDITDKTHLDLIAHFQGKPSLIGGKVKGGKQR